jgi:hypothetical protein
MLALVLGAQFLLYAGFFYLHGLVFQMGVPLDALRAAFHRLWLGVAATLVILVAYMIFRMCRGSVETAVSAGAVLIWLVRAGVWIWVETSVYRVTRWRKGKLALAVLAGLALNYGMDAAIAKIGETTPLLPALGEWVLRLC